MDEDEPSSEIPESVAQGTVIAGRYRVERRLGTGGMGEVYLVQHVRTDERFAMKVLLSQVISDKSALERFQREARTTARIESEHVVRVTDADVASELKGAPFLVMEYLRGVDLDNHITNGGPMPARDVVTFLQQVARALDKAHALGIVHRDLKPENIFITRREDGSPHLKILDFGIAKFTSGATSDLINKTATSPGQIYGTPLYMAPEQAKGESKRISPQTDLWALGLIANRMLSAKDYWDAETLTALIAQVVYEPMQKPSEKGFDFGPKYDDWFLRCCNRDADARFSTAGELVFKLGQALGVIDADAQYAPGAPSSVQAAPPPSLRNSSEPRPLSKTELQLAQTGLSEAEAARGDRGTFLKVAAGIAAVGVLVGAVWLTTRSSADRSGANAAAATDKATAAATTGRATSTAGSLDPALVTLADPSQTPTASASASEEPLVSVSASASEAPSASVSAGPKVGPIRTGRPRTGTTPPPPPPTKPPPPQDPLNGRL